MGFRRFIPSKLVEILPDGVAFAIVDRTKKERDIDALLKRARELADYSRDEYMFNGVVLGAHMSMYGGRFKRYFERRLNEIEVDWVTLIDNNVLCTIL